MAGHDRSIDDHKRYYFYPHERGGNRFSGIEGWKKLLVLDTKSFARICDTEELFS